MVLNYDSKHFLKCKNPCRSLCLFSSEREEENTRECLPALNPETDTHILNTPKSKRRSSHKYTRSKVNPHVTKDPDKENRHPFALYGSGERQTDMASKKTHNVGPATSTAEVSVLHEGHHIIRVSWPVRKLMTTRIRQILEFG